MDLAAKIMAVYRDLYPGREQIGLHEPSFQGREREYLLDCLERGWVAAIGDYGQRLRSLISAQTGVEHVLLVPNGSSALLLAFRAIGLEPGDEVLCPDLSFVAPAAVVKQLGGHLVFLDVESKYMALDPRECARFLEKYAVRQEKPEGWISYNRVSGRRIRAGVLLHNLGWPAPSAELLELFAHWGLDLIEDAAEAVGSFDADGVACGSKGKAGVLSFNGNKVLTAGGGGALLTNDASVYERARHLATTAKVPHPYRYLYDDAGYNLRMPELNAALALAQWERLAELVAKKREQAWFLRDALGDEVEVLEAPSGESNCWLLSIRSDRAYDLAAELNAQGLLVRTMWECLSSLPPYQQEWACASPVSQELSQTVLCLPNGLA